MDFGNLKIDEKASQEGIWVKFDDDDDTKFQIASAQNKKYEREIAKESRKYQTAKLRRNPALGKKIAIIGMARAVLISWSPDLQYGWIKDGVVKTGKKPGAGWVPNLLKPTEENKIMILTTIPDFREWVSEIAQDNDQFRQGVEAEEIAALKSNS